MLESDPELVTHHSIGLMNLSPATTYLYRVTSTGMHNYTSSSGGTFRTSSVYKTIVDATENDTLNIDIPDAGMYIDISVTEAVENATITVSSSTNSQVNDTLSVPALGKYIKIEVSESLEAVLSSVLITIQYTDNEVEAAGLEEESLSLYHYNPSGEWEKLTSNMDWVHSTGVDTVKNYVWANVTHFSDYAVGGEQDQEPPEILDTKPDGEITGIPALEVKTDEPAVCRYDPEDRNFSLMRHLFSGDGILHQDTVTLTDGSYLYYVRCNDSQGNTNQISAIIEFTITAPAGEDFTRPAREGEIICKPDGKKNYKETGIDCGGPCGKCPETTMTTTIGKTTSTVTTLTSPVTSSLPTTTITTPTTTITTPTTTIITTTIPQLSIIGQIIAFSGESAGTAAVVLSALLIIGYLFVRKRK